MRKPEGCNVGDMVAARTVDADCKNGKQYVYEGGHWPLTWTSTNSTKPKPKLAMVTLSLIRMMRLIPLAPSFPEPEDDSIAW